MLFTENAANSSLLGHLIGPQDSGNMPARRDAGSRSREIRQAGPIGRRSINHGCARFWQAGADAPRFGPEDFKLKDFTIKDFTLKDLASKLALQGDDRCWRI